MVTDFGDILKSVGEAGVRRLQQLDDLDDEDGVTGFESMLDGWDDMRAHGMGVTTQTGAKG